MTKNFSRLVAIAASLFCFSAHAAASDPSPVATCSVPAGYKASAWIKPESLGGDFDGDGRADIAQAIVENSSHKQGVAICLSSKPTATVIGAGKKLGNGGDNFDWMDLWSVVAGQGIRPKRDSLLLEKSESAGGLVTWNGKKFTWRQAGD